MKRKNNVANIKPDVPYVEDRVCAEDVVAVLEKYLEMAKSSEIIGVAIAVSHFDRTTTYAFRGKLGRATIGACMEMINKMVGE